MSAPQDAETEARLMRALWDSPLTNDPLRAVMYAFPWGEAGGPLARNHAPRIWQQEELHRIGLRLQRNLQLEAAGSPMEVYRRAIASGRGPGKSALIGLLTWWSLSTMPGATVIVSANGKPQLESKTWPEIAKWFGMAVNRHWFDITATAIRPRPWLAAFLQESRGLDSGYYYASAALWSKESPDSYAGAHNPRGLTLIFDEASGIPTPIWQVAEGFFTDASPRRFWCAFSNPRRSQGGFYECFHGNSARWETRQLDSRSVEGLDHSFLDALVAQGGEDSYEARVEVRGLFPIQDDDAFVSRAVVSDATVRPLDADSSDQALIMAVDVARFGEDHSVIRFRRGRDARTVPSLRFRQLGNVELANAIVTAVSRYKPDIIIVDGGGVGGGVVDILRAWKYRVEEFNGSHTPKFEPDKYANSRAEVWGRMRDWLSTGSIDSHPQLVADLSGMRYGFQSGDKILLESKDSLRGRGLKSPDEGDALAMTFAVRAAFGGLRQRPASRPPPPAFDPLGSL